MFLMVLISLLQLIVVLIVPLNGSPESDFIVGGVNAAPGEIPYQVSIQYQGRQHICGGSILNNCWILTAAHCVDQNPASSLIIMAGSTKLNSGGVKVAAEKAIRHENFKRPNTPDDIAVIKLKTCLTYSENIGPVELDTTDIKPGVIGIVSGWGYTDQNGKVRTNDLKKLQVKTISNNQCSRTYRKITKGNICTLNRAGQGFCQGDSGGPLVEANSKKQIGLVSANIPCAKNRPDLYTRISTYIPWIRKHIN